MAGNPMSGGGGGGDPAALAALQNVSLAINGLNTTLGNVFPGATAVSTTAPSSVGAITFSSSQVKGFISVISSSGATFKMALY